MKNTFSVVDAGGALKKLQTDMNGETQRFHGSWYRSENTHFTPTQPMLEKPDAFIEHVVQDWAPPAPIIDKQTTITSMGSCFARNVTN